MKRILSRYFIFRAIIALVLSGGLIPDLACQDSLNAVTLLKQAETQMQKDSLQAAFDLASQALQYAMRAGQEETEISVLKLIAELYNRQDQPGEAIPYYLRIADIHGVSGDTARLPDIYASIARNYHLEGVYEKEGEYYLNAFHFSPSSNHKARSQTLEKTALACLNAGFTDSSLVYFTLLRSLLEDMGQDDRRVLAYIVQSHNNAGRNEQALAYNKLLFGRYRGELDYRQMSVVKNNMAYNLTLMKDYDQAAISYQEAIDYGRQAGMGDKELAILMTNAGICYQNMDRGKQAIPFFRKAISALESSGDLAEKSRVENILALIYYNQGDLYNAGSFSKSSIASATLASDPPRLSEAYLTYSRILREGNDPIKALEFYENYLELRDSLEFETKLQEQDLLQRKDQLEKTERDLMLKLKEEQVKELDIQRLKLQLDKEEQERALIEQEKDIGLLEQERLKDSLMIARQQYIAEQQKREKDRLERENARAREQDSIRQMQQQREIQLLEQAQELDRLELDRQKTVRKALTWISILGVLITIIVLLSLVTTRKKNVLLGKQKTEIGEKNKDLEQKNEEISSQRDEIEAQRDMLSQQKDEIEHNNKEIVKSLEYASKIQSSTLPDLSSLNEQVADHFLFFRPRDIVSGDFYWTASVENTTILTVADCTGHGVPGAFMSMLGMSLLKEIVVKEYITHPAVILRRLRKEVINALRQKGMSGEQRDGMDMALVALHHDTGKLEFAGAYNPLYLVRRKEHPKPLPGEIPVNEPESNDNGHLLYEIPADKMPISHFLKMERFNSYEIDLLEGDNLYLFSDGYPDQFGGPRNKKFKYKPFKQMLLQNAHRSVMEQHEILGRTLDAWQGSHAQVDDICVIGLKI